uniref:ATP synthase subunit a n=1 Tax=Neopetrolisthes maculatus TaxID=941218 RepID=L0E7A3_9EUCA|nr:ATP synthase F0 subunit 6 [Neopetrolisthes maculatus]AGA56147.1 ATP synthase F0 subunit 6 [Neopetrolisthes maculatus]
MMTSLFSIFEPSSSIFDIPFNWISSIFGLIFIPYLFWILPSRWSLLWMKIMSALHNEFKNVLSSNQKSSSIVFVSLFSFIVFNNSLGLLPYIFTSTSHLVLTLSLSLPFWITLMIFGWVNYTQHMFAHLVPQGTPPVLMPFMVLIETTSNVIRPLTLAVRLAANMMAGHLLITLMSGVGPSLSTFAVLLLALSQILLLLLETAVAVIQSYVFAILSTLFVSEIN